MKPMAKITRTLAQCQTCGRLEDVSLDSDLLTKQETDHRLDHHPAERAVFLSLATVLDPWANWPTFPSSSRKIR